MTALEYAIQYAQKGWRVFPIKPGTKYPYKDFKWKDLSTNDPVKIRKAALSKKYKNCNWALDCGGSNVFVLDIDVIGGDAGFLAFSDLEIPGSGFEVETPSGGAHHYYEGQGPNTASRLGPGLDTRGGGGYVLIPGSVNGNGKPYVLVNDVVFPSVPQRITELLSVNKPKEPRKQEETLIELDKTDNITLSINYLKTQAPEAVEGAGGDQITYEIACKLRDFGLTENKTLELMVEHWNPEKASPNWTLNELEKKIENAYKYAQSPIGNATPDAIFPDPLKSTNWIKCAAELTISKIKERRWVLNSRFAPGYSTITVAPPGTGKSALAILECASVATGRELTYDAVMEKGGAWYYNTEDPYDEIERRIKSVEIEYGMNLRHLKEFYYSSGYGCPPKFAAFDAKGARVINEKLVVQFIEAIKGRGIKLLVLDPLVKCHSLKENSNDDMDFVMNIFSRIANESGCAVHVVHHTNKGGGKVVHGDMNAIRGGSSLVGAARIAHTLYNMSIKECKDYGVAAGRVGWYVRLDKAKANMSPPNSEPRWFEKSEVKIKDTDLDTTVVIRQAELIKVVQENPDTIVRDSVLRIMANVETKSVYSIAKALHQIGLKGLSERQIARNIQKLFAEPVLTGVGTLQVLRDGKSTAYLKHVKVFN